MLKKLSVVGGLRSTESAKMSLTVTRAVVVHHSMMKNTTDRMKILSELPVLFPKRLLTIQIIIADHIRKQVDMTI